MLVLTAAVVLAVESVARATPSSAATTPGAPGDLDSLLKPVRVAPGKSGYGARLGADPLAGRRNTTAATPGTVAPARGVSTVSSAGRRGRNLTAILIADQRSVAVIGDEVVGVGDRLPDGARVDAIRSDRVELVERSGQRRVLTLTTGRQ